MFMMISANMQIMPAILAFQDVNWIVILIRNHELIINVEVIRMYHESSIISRHLPSRLILSALKKQSKKYAERIGFP
jgi:hypothetical protein